MNFLCNFQSPRKKLFNDSQVANTVKTQGELDNTAKLTVKQFESWIFFMIHDATFGSATIRVGENEGIGTGF